MNWKGIREGPLHKMSSKTYIGEAKRLLEKIEITQREEISEAARLMAQSMSNGKLVHLFGSGHSVIPVLDIFPRYGSYVGFHPLMDPRLMWSNVVGPGGAQELLWLEREEGYIRNFLKGFVFDPGDCMVVFSHGGLNAAPVEAALYAKERGLKVIAVTSGENFRTAKATHSTGKKLGDVANVLIDNCVPLQDALVDVEGLKEPIAAGSTLAIVAISMTLVAEVAKLLAAEGQPLKVFVSPNVTSVSPSYNQEVFAEYLRRTTRVW